MAANNYAWSLIDLNRHKEVKTVMRKIMPIARRVFGDVHDITVRTRWIYALALYEDKGATPDDLREAVTSLEEVERTARRVFGPAHPLTKGIDLSLRNARAALRARETAELP